MAALDRTLAAQRWNAEYRKGRYVDEPPLPFVETILTALHDDIALWQGAGLYIGCGNGRNYLPLVDAGLDLYGLDLSAESLRQLAMRRPRHAERLICGDFRDWRWHTPLSYLIALQVLQHGTAADVATYFAHASTLLHPGGLFFLRVNAASTNIYHPHTLLEHNDWGGFTIRYEAGPKQGLPVHFYTRDALHYLTQDAFDLVMAPREDMIVRTPPKTGSWTQWEAIWKKR